MRMIVTQVLMLLDQKPVADWEKVSSSRGYTDFHQNFRNLFTLLNSAQGIFSYVLKQLCSDNSLL